MRKLVVRAADTAGNVVHAEWRVRDDQTDGHADAHSVVFGLYEQLVGGDNPMPASLEITTTFMQVQDSTDEMIRRLRGE